MLPGPDGTVFALIPKPGGGPVLGRFDRTGRSSPGWPIAIKEAEYCGLVLPVEDGTVRLLCVIPDALRVDRLRAFAFDTGGRSIAGWPVEPGPGWWGAGRMVGDALTLYGSFAGQLGFGMTIIASDGSIRRGTPEPGGGTRGGSDVEIAPDGIAYSVQYGAGQTDGSPDLSRITGLDMSGVRVSWPVKIDGIASRLAFGSGGRIVLVVGSPAGTTSWVVVIDPNGKPIASRSAKLPIPTAMSGVVDCGSAPPAPLMAKGDTLFLYSEMDTRIFALDPSLKVMPGWPYHPATPLVAPGHDDPRNELWCGVSAVPGVGPEGTLYLPLQPKDETVGGSIVAVDLDARGHPGWPVTLRRAGAEFLRVAVGPDGTVFALALEPEPGDTASATILAIAPDSTVLYRTTIIDP